MPQNQNYTETSEGWERNNDRQVPRSRVDWDKAKRESNWIAQIIADRERRNQEYRERKQKKDS